MITNQPHRRCFTLASGRPGLKIKIQRVGYRTAKCAKHSHLQGARTGGRAHQIRELPGLRVRSHVRIFESSPLAGSEVGGLLDVPCPRHLGLEERSFPTSQLFLQTVPEINDRCWQLGKRRRKCSPYAGFPPPLWSGDTAILNYPLTPFVPQNFPR